MLSSFKSEWKPFEDLARSFAAKELAGKTEEHDRYPFGEFFHDVLDKAYEVGFLGIMLPGELGGAGGSIGTLCAVLAALCRVDSSPGGIVFTNALAQEILLAAGARDIAGEIFGKTTSAGGFLVAFPSYTHPSHQDNLPEYRRSGRGYTITGTVDLLVLGGLARRAIVPARNRSKQQHSFFLIDLDHEGVSKSEPVFTLGMHACPAVDVRLDRVRARLVGEEGKGGEYFDRVLPAMHIAAAAMNAGIMRGSLDEALAYARERFQGGREIIRWSEVSMLLAGMAVKADAADMCVTLACQALEQGDPGWSSRCAAAALHIHEIACKAVTDGVQILGGNGYMKDYGQEKRFRDARQVQSLLGSVPARKLDLIRKVSGA